MCVYTNRVCVLLCLLLLSFIPAPRRLPAFLYTDDIVVVPGATVAGIHDGMEVTTNPFFFFSFSSFFFWSLSFLFIGCIMKPEARYRRVPVFLIAEYFGFFFLLFVFSIFNIVWSLLNFPFLPEWVAGMCTRKSNASKRNKRQQNIETIIRIIFNTATGYITTQDPVCFVIVVCIFLLNLCRYYNLNSSVFFLIDWATTRWQLPVAFWMKSIIVQVVQKRRKHKHPNVLTSDARAEWIPSTTKSRGKFAPMTFFKFLEFSLVLLETMDV